MGGMGKRLTMALSLPFFFGGAGVQSWQRRCARLTRCVVVVASHIPGLEPASPQTDGITTGGLGKARLAHCGHAKLRLTCP